MATRAEQIVAIREALAKGVSSVTIDGTTTRKDLGEMRRWLLQLEAEERAANATDGNTGFGISAIVSPNARGTFS